MAIPAKKDLGHAGTGQSWSSYRSSSIRRGTVTHDSTAQYRQVQGKHQRGNTMAETYNGYCVKCKEKRDFEGEAVETNGRRMAKGICPVCGTKMNRILGKAQA